MNIRDIIAEEHSNLKTAGSVNPEKVYQMTMGVMSEFDAILKEASKQSDERDIDDQEVYATVGNLIKRLKILQKYAFSETNDSDNLDYALERMADAIRRRMK